MKPFDKPWLGLYCNFYEMSPVMRKKFQRRFRVPFYEVKNMLEYVKYNEMFDKWQSYDTVGHKLTPIDIIVLSVLRLL